MADEIPIKSYQDLRVWRKGMDIAVEAYKLTATFPKDELFGLSSQIRRSATSIPANIAEGFGRGSSGSFAHFLGIAQGSLKELETHVILAHRVGLLSSELEASMLNQADEIGRMLGSLIRRVRKYDRRPTNNELQRAEGESHD